jgi:L-lactate dehydrogenase complex protein LldF
MSSAHPTFKDRSDDALCDEFLRTAVKFTADRLRSRKEDSTGRLGDWEIWREQGRAVRTDVIANLDYYLDSFARNAEARGAHVHFADDAAEAVNAFLGIVRASGAKLVVKSKSMVSEEIHINHALEAIGVGCIESDLGEWIVQLAHEMPSHIIIPAIHKNRRQIQDLFEEEGGEPLGPETPVLAGFARRRLREKFQQADIGMTGCNFGLAETGSVVTFSNEGNARMVTTLPRVHIVVMGMERLLPGWDELELMVNLLPRSATGQKITTYVSVLSGPRRAGELDGPDEVHIIVLDNGRSRQLADPEFREVLNCIRCGACLNVCPVYRQVGGHSYGSVYPGPIGAVLTPLLQQDDKTAGGLAYASSLCGACYEACPVKIPLHDMLVHLRRRYVEAGHAGVVEAMAMKGFAAAFSSPGRYAAAGKAARFLQLAMIGDGGGRLVPGPLRGWTDSRALPLPPKRTFREIWPELEAEEGADGA